MQKQRENGEVIDVRTKKLGRVGPKPKEWPDALLQSVPLRLRTTERSYAAALGISHVTLYRLIKQGKLRVHSSNNHPALSADHKIARMNWVLSHIIPGTPTTNPRFVDMDKVIHIDEKWFYLNPETRKFYLCPLEEDPYRCQQSKRFKVKGMFMGLIGRVLQDEQGRIIHDGKYGIFPFVYEQMAKKSSKNRQAGTMELKAHQHVTKDIIRDMLLNKVIPAILEKWPRQLGRNVYIQWDNARPHKIPTDPEFVAAATQRGLNIQMIYQPAQSPDLNVLDLGLFNSIQSLQYHTFPTNLSELIKEVENAYTEFDPIVNRNSWLTLQMVMLKILQHKGGNNFKTPHMAKERLENVGILPRNVPVDKHILEEAIHYLSKRFRPSDRPNDTNAEQEAGNEEGRNEVDAD
ncbi:uncharacterized protein LOC110708858 [Chenopodium quinoa]|uniref:uncharacterized protein LOC110698347 n=1 Tax=Chenopodium quinoa TaxID=63459 RepID=UPI000B78BEE1|nr:uncharacterized protein LOC110698347 [Chenopodium quinoa]XP_021742774.1 uncharacterized protein LOC110708858 [Chenopodium quinoa]